MEEKLQVQAPEIRRGLPYPPNVLYAGESARRMAFIRHAFNKSNISNCPIGPEPPTSVEGVTRYKLNVGLRTVSEEFVGAIIAADTQTVIPKVEDGEVKLVSRGKPSGPQELLNSLIGMKNASDLTGEQPFYSVETFSGLLHVNVQHVQVEDKQNCLVVLKKKKMDELTMEEGFLNYLAKFVEFYSQPPYSTYNMKPITPADLSGGLSLPVLIKMGMVQSVSGINETDDRFREKLKHNIYLVAVGISPDILEAVDVDSKKTIHDWYWLDSVVDHALS